MSPVQTTYDAGIAVALPGLVADNNPERTISKKVETAAIPFGLAVSRGTADDQVVLGGDDNYVGIAKRVHDQENPVGSESSEYAVGDTIAVVQEGSIFLNVTTNGIDGAALKYIDATGVIASGVAGAGETAISGGTVEETITSAPQVVLCRLKGA